VVVGSNPTIPAIVHHPYYDPGGLGGVRSNIMAKTLNIPSIFSIPVIEPEVYKQGSNNQIYCEFTKSGKHYIYAHFEKDTNNLFYIGLGKLDRCNQVNQRNDYWKRVANKHGRIIKFLEINLTPEKAVEKEKYYISRYKPRTNLTPGGDFGNCTGQRVKVYAYFKNGDFYKSFDSITEANAFLNQKENDSRIGRCLNGSRKSFAGLIWKEKYFNKVDPYKKSEAYNQRKVYRYDLDGNFIESKDKLTDFGFVVSGICSAIDSNYTYKNSFWRSYYSEIIDATKLKPALKEAKRVINTKTGEIFKSIGEAAKNINYPRKKLEYELSYAKSYKTPMRYYE
jgi:hypothetical protein